MIPGFRLLRKLFLLVAILGILFVGANVVAARVAEGKIAEAAQREFGLPSKPEIHIGGFPIILDVLRGTLPSVSFVASGVVVQDLRIETAAVDLKGIGAHGLFGGDVTVTVASGSVRATVAQSDLNAFLRKHNGDTSIVLRAGNNATVSAVRDGLHYVANGVVSISGGAFVFTPRTVTIEGRAPPPGFEAEAKRRATVRVAIPKLPGGVAVTRVATAPGNVTLVASMKNRTFSLKR
jgi:hypothetical protein